MCLLLKKIEQLGSITVPLMTLSKEAEHKPKQKQSFHEIEFNKLVLGWKWKASGSCSNISILSMHRWRHRYGRLALSVATQSWCCERKHRNSQEIDDKRTQIRDNGATATRGGHKQRRTNPNPVNTTTDAADISIDSLTNDMLIEDIEIDKR